MMAEDSKTSQLHDRVAERAGGKINCPICGNRGWVEWDDSVVTLTVSSQVHWRQTEEDNPDQSEARDDDYGSVPAIGAFCERCGFIRLHAVNDDDLT
jgi:uncharacterized Zn finger protein (UPF0148 family)